MDIDEFVAVDPDVGMDLPEFLERLGPDAMCAAMGLDVIHNVADEPLVDDKPILLQRRNAVVTREYSKLVAVTKPLRWVGGFHRSRHVEIDIPSDLYLFHLALFDRQVAQGRMANRSSVQEHETWRKHLETRLERCAELDETDPLELDDLKDQARTQLMESLPSKTGPHPGIIKDGNVQRGYHIRIPDRLTRILPLPNEFWPIGTKT